MSKYFFSYDYLDGWKGWVADDNTCEKWDADTQSHVSVPREPYIGEVAMPEEFEARWEAVHVLLNDLAVELHKAKHAASKAKA